MDVNAASVPKGMKISWTNDVVGLCAQYKEALLVSWRAFQLCLSHFFIPSHVFEVVSSLYFLPTPCNYFASQQAKSMAKVRHSVKLKFRLHYKSIMCAIERELSQSRNLPPMNLVLLKLSNTLILLSPPGTLIAQTQRSVPK